MAAPRRGELAGVPAGRRRCSAVWERGESKRAVGIGFWGICRARALARRVLRLLQRALHRGGEVAAARVLLDIGGARGTAGEIQREATGGGGAPGRRVGDSARRINGRDGREGAPRRRRAALSVGGGENRAGRWEMGIRVVLQFLKIPGTTL